MSKRITRSMLRKMIMNEVRQINEAAKELSRDQKGDLRLPAESTMAKALGMKLGDLQYYSYDLRLSLVIGEDANTVSVTKFEISDFGEGQPQSQPSKEKKVKEAFAKSESRFQQRLEGLDIDPGTYSLRIAAARRKSK